MTTVRAPTDALPPDSYRYAQGTPPSVHVRDLLADVRDRAADLDLG